MLHPHPLKKEKGKKTNKPYFRYTRSSSLCVHTTTLEIPFLIGIHRLGWKYTATSGLPPDMWPSLIPSAFFFWGTPQVTQDLVMWHKMPGPWLTQVPHSPQCWAQTTPQGVWPAGNVRWGRKGLSAEQMLKKYIRVCAVWIISLFWIVKWRFSDSFQQGHLRSLNPLHFSILKYNHLSSITQQIVQTTAIKR